MLGRARRDAQAVAGGLWVAVFRPGPPGPGEDGHQRCDCQAEGERRHWRERRGRPPEDGRPLAEQEGRTRGLNGGDPAAGAGAAAVYAAAAGREVFHPCAFPGTGARPWYRGRAADS